MIPGQEVRRLLRKGNRVPDIYATVKQTKKDKNIWFPAKKYGIGWGLPVVWQGWVVLFIYTLLVTTGTLILARSPQNSLWLLPFILILTVIFILIVWRKGEKIQFRWGNKK